MSDRARAFREASRHTVVLPSGGEVVIQKVDQMALADRDTGESTSGFLRALMEMAMVDPKLWTGPESECPEDAVLPSHIGIGDMKHLIGETMRLNGIAPEEVAGAVDSFRVHRRGLAGSERRVGGPNGETLEDLSAGNPEDDPAAAAPVDGDLPESDTVGSGA